MSGTISIAANGNYYFTTIGTTTDTLSVGSMSILNVYSTTTTAVNLTLSDLDGADSSFTINAGSYGHVDFNASERLTAADTFNIGRENTSASSNITTGHGTFEFGSNVTSLNLLSSVNFYGTGNTLIADSSALSANFATPINGFVYSDAIDLDGIAYTPGDYAFWAQSSQGGGTLEILDSDDNLLSTLTFGSGTYRTSKFVIGSDTAGGVKITLLCFLRGTMIETPSGEMAVERLCEGDPVTVLEQGRRVTRTVSWIGSRHMDGTSRGMSDRLFPVRIRKNAFADNVPHRDLLVTPEHCILVDGGLVPARMLVNGASIVIDRTIPDYDFFHVELEDHAILLAEGLPAESYLDTGHRALFADADAAVTVNHDRPMAAPLTVSRDKVEPVWNRLAERARVLGLVHDEATPALTDQPDMRLLLDDGLELQSCWHDTQRHMFHIPKGRRAVGLLSRAAVPAEVDGPFVDDRRTLGVMVGGLVLWNGLKDTPVLPDALDMPGWHAREGDARWTDGRASLDLPVADAETFVDIRLAGTMRYREPLSLAA